MDTDVERGIAVVRGAIESHGLLLLCDNRLPSVTLLLAGEPIEGSWWGHPKGNLIWEVLQVIDEEVATAKLAVGKVTLVHQRLWGDLAAVGGEGAAWQRKNLDRSAQALAREVEQHGQLRSDEVLGTARGDDRKRKKGCIDQLEKRLLVYAEQIHSESGKHVRVLTSWPRFVADRKVELPKPASARARLEACVAPWAASSKRPLLPWL